MTTSKNDNKSAGVGSALLNRLKYGSSFTTGAHLQPSGHTHGSGCGCSHGHDEDDEE